MISLNLNIRGGEPVEQRDLERLVEAVIANILREKGLKRRCLWLVESVPKNGYVLDHAFELYSQDHRIDLLIYSGDKNVFSEAKLQSFGHRIIPWPRDSSEFLDYDSVCLFNLSLPTLSKLAHLIIDDDITELVFAILQRGIEVTMDAWSDRHEFSNLAPGLRQKIAGLLRDVESYGVTQKSFATILRQESQLTELPKKGIMSLGDLKEALASGQDPDQLAKNSRLTPLAIDYLQDLRRAGDFGKRWNHERKCLET
jgi:hypothetical protein